MKLGLVFGLLGTLAFSGVAFADDSAPPSNDPDLVRLAPANGHSLKWNYVPSGKTDRYGHAEVLISAPLPYVRELILDYSHYKDYSGGKFKTSRLVDKTDTTSDVYFQVPVLHGMVMLWQVVRFAPRVAQPGVEVVQGAFVRGNVKGSDVAFTMRAVGDKTILKADLLVNPDFAAPQAMIDEELRDAAQNAVDAVQARAQQKYAQWVAHQPSTPDATTPTVASATSTPSQAPTNGTP
jgi:hypothetical protein